MPDTFKDIFRSSHFIFCVGEAKEEVLVHAKAFAGISDPLDRMINGDLKEASDKYAELPDVDPEGFLRLCEFAYRGKYTGPDLKWSDLNIVPKWFGHDNDEDDVSPAETVLAALFAHAKTYCLGDRYLVRGLKEEALNHLRLTFDTFVDVARNAWEAGRIVELVRFAYLNDNIRDAHDNDKTVSASIKQRCDDSGCDKHDRCITKERWQEIDPLRRTILKRLAGLASKLDLSIEFRELLEEGGEFVVDYWHWLRNEQKDNQNLLRAMECGDRRKPLPSTWSDEHITW